MRGMITVSILNAGNSEPLRVIGNVSQQEKRMNFTHWLDFPRHARPLTLLEGFAYQLFAIVFRFLCQILANNLSNSYQFFSTFFRRFYG
jgi:hypothetical protein